MKLSHLPGACSQAPHIILIASMIALAASAAAGQLPAPAEQRFDGPTLFCGEAFGLRIAAGESVLRRDPGIDFLLYHVEAHDGRFLLYEGNAPMAHDDAIRTGRPFPDVIAIHDNRTPAAKARSRIRDRLIVGEAQARACPSRTAR